MATYFVLSKFTPQGISNVKDGPSRIDAGRQAARAMGTELKARYLAMGRYDVITIWEAPNDEAMAKSILALTSLGNVTSETLRVFTEDEFRKMVAELP